MMACWTRLDLPSAPSAVATASSDAGAAGHASYRTIYGPGELEAYRHVQLQQSVKEAKLKVWYPGSWYRHSPRAYFRTKLDGTSVHKLWGETNNGVRDVVLMKFRSSARIVSAELIKEGRSCNEQSPIRFQLRCQSTHGRVGYEHTVFLPAFSENVDIAASVYQILLELDTRLPLDNDGDIIANKSAIQPETGGHNKKETVDLESSLIHPPPCLAYHQQHTYIWEWRIGTEEAWIRIYTCWSPSLNEHLAIQRGFPHQEDLHRVDVLLSPSKRLVPSNDAQNHQDDAIIYDFCRQVLGKVRIAISWIGPVPSMKPEQLAKVQLRVGETLQEVLNDDEEYFEQCCDLSCQAYQDGHVWVSAHLLAFRYVRLIVPVKPDGVISVQCDSFPRLERRGEFSTESVNSIKSNASSGAGDVDNIIWECAEHTLQLCIHNNFIVDGIKRDRLPWAGDLAVSLMANAYSFRGEECIRWTLTVLGRCGVNKLSFQNGDGVEPDTKQSLADSHINGCVDYTFWFIISHWLYQRYFGDAIFLQMEWRLIELRMICLIQHCSDKKSGWFVIGEDDWIFIDWNVEGDNATTLQVLWWYALDCSIALTRRMADLETEDTQKQSMQDFMRLLDETQLKLEKSYLEKDDILAGFSRHAHILGALSGLFARLDCRASGDNWWDPDSSDKRWQTVRRCRSLHDKSLEALTNYDLPPVATPYMKHLECLAISRLGERNVALEKVRSYWGGMLDAGATSFFEAFNESESSADISQFYDRPFARSLCHAWASGPCALYPEIVLGLAPLSDGWEEWICDPLDFISSVSATVETKFGKIKLQLDDDHLNIIVPTGTAMILMEKRYSSGSHRFPRKSLVSSQTVRDWSKNYRGWHHHPTHIIEPNPSIPGHESIQMTDVPTVYQLHGDDLYYMSFVGFDGVGYQSFVAESPDLLEWRNPRLAMGYGKEGSFDYGGVVLGAFLLDNYAVDAPRTLKKKGGKYYCLYGAYAKKGDYEPDPGYQGLASSADALVWEREKDESILSVHGPGIVKDWESSSIYQPWLVEYEALYYNFYNAKQMPQWIEQIGLATSNDLCHWTRYKNNPILPVVKKSDATAMNNGFDTQFASDAKVFYDFKRQHWVMFYFGVGKGGAHIMIAFSRDLIHWVRDPIPLYMAGGNPSGLDKKYSHKISLVWNPIDETWYMFYCAAGDAGRGIGLITSRKM